MEINRAVSAMVGILQTVLGVAFGLLTILLGLEMVDIQTILSTPPEFLPLYLMAFGLFSGFSVINAVFLIREWRR
jgi:hypothetical protein